MQLHTLAGWQISERLKAKELSVSEVVAFFRKRIEDFNPGLNAVVSLFDQPIGPLEGSDSKLWGVPILIKDNICIKDRPATCASRILEGFIAPYDAEVITRIKKAGLVIMGTANMDEFAFGSSCENSCYGPTRNPWDRSRVPGGSSGGSAAAVASGIIPLALGSDTGGSIRQPASLCGVIGFKPTYGRVSRYGLVAFGSSLDQIGPLTRDAADCAYLLNILSGRDVRDSTSSEQPVEDLSRFLKKDIKGFKVALVRQYLVEGLDREVKKSLEEAIRLLGSKGVEFTEIDLPSTEYAVPTYYILASSEASSNLSRFEGIKYGRRVQDKNLISLYRKTRRQGFGKEAKRRIMLGTFSLSSGYYQAYYLKALKARALIKRDFERVFQSYDAIITPTSPTPAFAIGEKAEDPISMYLSDIYTISSNLAGNPAVSVPCGFSGQGLPIGFQVIAGHFQESKIVQIATAYQKSTEWHRRFPKDYE